MTTIYNSKTGLIIDAIAIYASYGQTMACISNKEFVVYDFQKGLKEKQSEEEKKFIANNRGRYTSSLEADKVMKEFRDKQKVKKQKIYQKAIDLVNEIFRNDAPIFIIND